MSADVGTAIRLQYNRLTGPMPVTLILSHVLVSILRRIAVLPGDDQAVSMPAALTTTCLQEFDASWNNLTNNVKDILLLTYAKRTKLRYN